MDLKKNENAERDIEFEYYKRIREKMAKSEMWAKEGGKRMRHFRSYLYQRTLEKLAPMNSLS